MSGQPFLKKGPWSRRSGNCLGTSRGESGVRRSWEAVGGKEVTPFQAWVRAPWDGLKVNQGTKWRETQPGSKTGHITGSHSRPTRDLTETRSCLGDFYSISTHFCVVLSSLMRKTKYLFRIMHWHRWKDVAMKMSKTNHKAAHCPFTLITWKCVCGYCLILSRCFGEGLRSVRCWRIRWMTLFFLPNECVECFFYMAALCHCYSE